MDLNINLNVNFPQFDIVVSELVKALNNKLDKMEEEEEDLDFGPGICPEDYK